MVTGMPPYLDAVAGSSWVLAVAFVVAGLDAILPFTPSETTVVACGVAAAGTGRPHLGLLVLAAAAGAYAGDVLAFRLARRGSGPLTRRLTHRRAVAVQDWVRRLLHRRGGLVIVAGRYLPGGRSATAVAAAVAGYPAARFRRWTALGVLLWAAQAALLGYLGGAVFAGRPLLGLLLAWSLALAGTGLALLGQRLLPRRPPVTRATDPVHSRRTR
jgi:membrane-associated protein